MSAADHPTIDKTPANIVDTVSGAESTETCSVGDDSVCATAETRNGWGCGDVSARGVREEVVAAGAEAAFEDCRDSDVGSAASAAVRRSEIAALGRSACRAGAFVAADFSCVLLSEDATRLGAGSSVVSVGSDVLLCAPPELRTIPVVGSSVADDPIDVVAVTLVELLCAEAVLVPVSAEVDGLSESFVEDVAPVEDAAPVDVAGAVSDAEVDEADADADAGDAEASSFGDAGPAFFCWDDDSVSLRWEPESASPHATPGGLATAAPTPRATANAPTRPMYFALPISGTSLVR